ncbi:serine/arginine-rich splicing factor 7-like isoform X2 [Phymastichus coffea]|uniref:serine/arginine-rich splicing factor 7-like isoform X2 n=1 Tax=Phymastichus coffea TaxID=108790 RepID=UPI00273BD3D0|nr:serine/arginine-rich splicing factor 7-like isoform X2 [Phymastichus coffea]
MNKMSRYPSDCKVYVGDLGSNATKQEIEDAFSYYGPLKNVWVARNPPGFAFVEFDDPRDAEDAIKGLDGRTVCGRRARVELSNGKRSRDRGPPSRSGSGGGGGGRGGPASRYNSEDRCYDCGERGHYARDCSRQKKKRRCG